MLRNAVVSAEMVLPSCQDTGTAIVFAHKGEDVHTGGGDEEALSHGIFDAYTGGYLRYSQLAPLDMFEERNTGTNLPAQIEIHSVPGAEYEFLFVTKGGGSANKTLLFQESKAAAQPGVAAALPRREAALAGHRRLPALPPGPGHRRHLGRGHPEDREAGLLPLPRRPPHHRQRARPGVPRPRDGATGPRTGPGHRHRGAIRRQVLLPRRPGDPPPPPRRLLPGGHRGLLLCRPPDQGQDHRRRRLPGAAGDRPGPVPAGRTKRCARPPRPCPST